MLARLLWATLLVGMGAAAPALLVARVLSAQDTTANDDPAPAVASDAEDANDASEPATEDASEPTPTEAVDPAAEDEAPPAADDSDTTNKDESAPASDETPETSTDEPTSAESSAEPEAATPESETADTANDADSQKHLLRYKFQAGETIRWQIEHRAEFETIVNANSQTAQTMTSSRKAWRVTNVDPEGRATFVHSVEHVEMSQKVSGRQELHYNSSTDETPAAAFEEVAKSVGIPLTEFVMDAQGNLISRKEKRPDVQPTKGRITIPLPDGPVGVGDQWSTKEEVVVRDSSKVVRKIKTRQVYTIEKIKQGIATILGETQILTPVSDPQVEAQLIQVESSSTIQFDIAAGRLVSLQTDQEKRVHGIHGEASTLHCNTHFSEKLLPNTPETARREPRKLDTSSDAESTAVEPASDGETSPKDDTTQEPTLADPETESAETETSESDADE